MCIVPKFIIDWFMIMISFVLKSFVSSRPFKLEGVLCIYVLLFHEGQAENHFDIFFHMNWTHVWLSLFHYSWSFVCVSFHVITWLLSFLLSRLCLLCPCFKFFDPSTQCLLRWSRLWWCMSPQKLFFSYHLPTRGWAGVKLGNAWYVSNVSIIFDAPCLFYTICFMFGLHFVAFLCDFWN
jgi:hypothetical protein